MLCGLCVCQAVIPLSDTRNDLLIAEHTKTIECCISRYVAQRKRRPLLFQLATPIVSGTPATQNGAP